MIVLRGFNGLITALILPNGLGLQFCFNNILNNLLTSFHGFLITLKHLQRKKSKKGCFWGFFGVYPKI